MSSGQLVDFDVHGLAGVRLIDATADDAAAVRRELGRLEVPAGLARDPDLTIRFVDHLAHGTPLRYLGKDDAAFTDDAFLVLRSRLGARAKVAIPLTEVGGPCVVTAERGLSAVPLLLPMLNLAILGNGALPLHAAAFVTAAGRGVVATGWSKGGKTEALLAFVQHGARFVADEWAYLLADGSRVHGIPDLVRVWDWHLDGLPDYRRRLSPVTRSRLRALSVATRLPTALPRRARRGRLGSVADRTGVALEAQRHVDIAPQTLFGDDLGSLAGPVDRLFLMNSAEVAGTTVDPIDPMEVAARMRSSLHHERSDLLAAYDQLRYAFPDAVNPWLEEAGNRERDLLRRAFARTPAWRVDHPRPLPLEDLYRAMAPYA